MWCVAVTAWRLLESERSAVPGLVGREVGWCRYQCVGAGTNVAIWTGACPISPALERITNMRSEERTALLGGLQPSSGRKASLTVVGGGRG